MTPEEVRTLFDYDGWANNRTLDSCSTLSPEQFTHNLGSSFGSVRDTLVHITGSQWIWLERFRGRSHSAPPAPMDAFADLAAVRESADRIQGELSAHVAALTAADLARNLEYRNTQGTSFQTPIWQVLQHLANHGTYHRGQVTTLLRQLGAKPVSTDLIGFYRERAKDPGK